MAKFFTAGDYRYGQCPKCKSAANTLVLAKSGVYTCMACGYIGTVTKQPDTSVQHPNDRILALNKKAAEVFQKDLYSSYGKTALQYITKRKLSKETIRNFGIGYSSNAVFVQTALSRAGFSEAEMVASGLFGANENGELWYRFKNRLMFPIADTEGNVIGFSGRVLDNSEPKYKNTPETAVFSKRSNLFAFDKAKASGKDYLILCEGQMDVIAMHQAGFTNAVASLGTALTDEQAALIKSMVNRVIVLYDTDFAGKKATAKAIGRLEDAQLKAYVSNTAPSKDPDEFLGEYGAEELRKRISRPMPADEFRVRNAVSESGEADITQIANILLNENSVDQMMRIVKNVNKKESSC